MPYRVVADENIPLVAQAFGRFGPVTLLPGGAITNAVLREADVLLVRSVTPVDEALLTGTPVRFVGTATIGTDHVDAGALAARGVAFASAPGSNAESVVEWVIAALLALSADRGGRLAGKTAGVVGVGNVGGRLAPRLEALGLRVLRCDPPRARAEGAAGFGAQPASPFAPRSPSGFVPLEMLLAESDIVTLHTPLTASGPDATRGLVGAAELAAMRPGAWLVNASRGAVVDGAALLGTLARGHIGAALLDVFEGEPAPEPALVTACALATPHVAGYSFDGKAGGTRALLSAFARWSGLSAASDADAAFGSMALALAPEDRRVLAAPDPHGAPEAALDALVRVLYPIRDDDARLRATIALPAAARAQSFAALRKTYPRRRRWGLYALPEASVPEPLRRAVRDGLGLRLV